jgi:glycosyltransferase involved in cell wall biosynthesis
MAGLIVERRSSEQTQSQAIPPSFRHSPVKYHRMRVLYFSHGYTVHDRCFLSKMKETSETWFLTIQAQERWSLGPSLPAGVRRVEWAPSVVSDTGSTDSILGRMSDFQRILREVKPDLLQAGPIQSCGFMAALSGFSPFLAVSWGSDLLVDAGRDDTARWITRYTLERADMLWGDCDGVRRKANEFADYGHDRFLALPWGTDIEKFRPEADRTFRRRLGWEEAFVVISSRSWEPLYRVPLAVESFGCARAQNSDLRLILLGGGAQTDIVKRTIFEQGLDEYVWMPGTIDREDLPVYLRAADLYLSCSSSDGSSVSLLEALAVGLPVVVTDYPTNHEWVEPGVNGWFGEPDDVSSFAAAIGKIRALDVARLEEMKQRNRKVAEDRADWDKNSSRLAAIHRKLTG